MDRLRLADLNHFDIVSEKACPSCASILLFRVAGTEVSFHPSTLTFEGEYHCPQCRGLQISSGNLESSEPDATRPAQPIIYRSPIAEMLFDLAGNLIDLADKVERDNEGRRGDEESAKENGSFHAG